MIRRTFEARDKLVVWGSGKQTRSFIYVTDLVKAICIALEKYAVADPINLGSSEEVTIHDLAYMIVRLSGRRNLKVVFDTSKPEGMPRKASDIQKMKKILGFRPMVSLEQGLKKTIDWFLENRYIASR